MKLADELKILGFEQSHADPCMFLENRGWRRVGDGHNPRERRVGVWRRKGDKGAIRFEPVLMVQDHGIKRGGILHGSPHLSAVETGCA